jgi:hypothetical protein
MALPTTTQPQTITAGPPVVYNHSGDNDHKKPIVEVTHQTKIEQGRNACDDTDDRERNTEILPPPSKPKLVITSQRLTCTKLKSRLGEGQSPQGKRQVAGENSLQLLLVPHPCQLRLIPGVNSPQLSHLVFLRHRVCA